MQKKLGHLDIVSALESFDNARQTTGWPSWNPLVPRNHGCKP